MKKVHLHRSNRDTWCGRELRPKSNLSVTRDSSRVTCLTCIKADAAETRKQQNV